MRTMKDSGVAWIGEIPEEWEATMLKNHVVCLDGQRIPVDAAQRSPGVYPYWGAGNIVDHVDNFLFDEELVLLGEDGAPFFDPYRPVAFYSNEKIWVNNHIHVLRAKSINAKYLVYSLNSIDYSLYINGSILSKLTQSNMNKIFLCYPPLPEQRRIADYLDAKCAEIDRSMELVRQGIDKLKEYKKSVITEAVTKGLDPDVPMKDSGVPWLGDIPEGWKVTRLKFVSTINPRINIAAVNPETEVSFLPMENIKNGYMVETIKKFLTEYTSSYNIFENGDILLAKVTPCFENGNIAIANNLNNSLGFGTSEIFVVRSINIDTKFLFYWLRNEIFRLRAIATMSGTGGLKRISTQFLRDENILVPPLPAQRCIAAYLDAKCAEIDTLITQKQELLDKLAEYKKSLIFECVTGKREVAA